MELIATPSDRRSLPLAWCTSLTTLISRTDDVAVHGARDNFWIQRPPISASKIVHPFAVMTTGLV